MSDNITYEKRRQAEISDKVYSHSFYKQQSVELGHIYANILGRECLGTRVYLCGTSLEYGVKPDGGMDLIRANFCQLRLCPLCAMRRSRKIFAQVSQVMNVLEQRLKYRYIFLTMTVRNMSGQELDQALDEMKAGFKRLCREERWKKAVKGWYRGLEITYNAENDTYHPHYHVILTVNPSYFTDRTYISQHDWSVLWQSSMRLNYDPVVDVRAIKPGDAGCGKAVAEASKYIVKPDSLCGNDGYRPDVVALLTDVLHRRKLIGFGGVMAAVRRELKLSDPVDGNLTDIEAHDLRMDVYTLIETWHWRVGAYKCDGSILNLPRT